MKKRIALFLMNKKGFAALDDLVSGGQSSAADVTCVVVARDIGTVQDYYQEIVSIARKASIPTLDRADQNQMPPCDYRIAIGWRWLIPDNGKPLIVLHDSLLPKLRGFNPLVTALIMGEPETGVTAFIADTGFDTGPMVGQEKLQLTYPIKIAEVIDKLSVCYARLLGSVISGIQSNALKPTPQNEAEATYSLWRNDDDYKIDWSDSADNLSRFVNALGFPYKGASTMYGGKRIRVQRVELAADLHIVNRTPGKILFLKDNQPTVVCGQGLLVIEHATYVEEDKTVTFDKLRVKLQ